MKAVVMAGGVGSRLRPLTIERPKPMIPFVGKPVLAHLLNLLKQHHIYEVVLTVRYLADQIQDYFGDGRHLGMVIHYAVEETPLGTAGSVKNTQPYLGNQSFLVISGDIITDIDLTSLIQFHRRKRGLATLALTRVANPREYGLVIADQSGRIDSYVEKPDRVPPAPSTINTGVYVLEPEVLDYMEPHVAYDFSYDLFPRLLRQRAPVFGCVTSGYWRDIGTLQSYIKATTDALTGKISSIDLPAPYLTPQLMSLKEEFGEKAVAVPLVS